MLKYTKIFGILFLLFIVIGCNNNQEETYTVSFNHEDAAPIEAEQGEIIEIPMVISDSGFLLGWEDELGTLYDTNYTVEEDITLEPVFEMFDDVLDLQFNDEENSVSILSYSGNARHVIVPHTIDGYYVRSINGFRETTPTIVEVPMTVNDFGATNSIAFSYMPNLEEFHFYGEYLGTYEQTLGETAFTDYINDYEGCTVPTSPDEPSVENPWLFDETCPIAKITTISTPVLLPGETEYVSTYEAEMRYKYAPEYIAKQRINRYLFYRSENLQEITLPDKLFYFDDGAFFGLENVMSVKIENNSKYYIEDGLLFLKDDGWGHLIIVDDEVVTIESDALLYYPSGLLKETTVIPDTVKFIYDYAFKSDKVETIIIHEDLLFSPGAFAYLTHLKNIDINENHSHYTDIDGVVYSKDLETLLNHPAGKEAITYDIPDGIKYIGSHAFFNQTHIESLIIPEGVTRIGDEAFINNRSLTYIDFPTTVENVGFRNLQYHIIETPLPGEKFYEIETLILRNTNQVVNDYRFFLTRIPFHKESFTIYVPDHLLDEYLQNDYWSDAVDHFKPLSELDES